MFKFFVGRNEFSEFFVVLFSPREKRVSTRKIKERKKKKKKAKKM